MAGLHRSCILQGGIHDGFLAGGQGVGAPLQGVAQVLQVTGLAGISLQQYLFFAMSASNVCKTEVAVGSKSMQNEYYL